MNIITRIQHKIATYKKENLLRISLGVIYTWFGILKFLPNQSPAEHLAKETLHILSFKLIPADISFFLLAVLETTIGILLLTHLFKKFVLWFALFHMLCTFLPVFMFTNQIFSSAFVPTLTGQYIIKNLVLCTAILAIKDIDKRS